VKHWQWHPRLAHGWSNLHAAFVLLVEPDGGEAVEWNIKTSSPAILMHLG
jgi:hypothetical protein